MVVIGYTGRAGWAWFTDPVTPAGPPPDPLQCAHTALRHASPTTTMRYIRGRDIITGSPSHAVAAAIIGTHGNT